MQDKDNIIDKIKKCLRLSKSSNEHEAAAALRQAQKLMEAYSIEREDILASEAAEARAKSLSTQRSTDWEHQLALIISRAFRCDRIYSRGEWVFVGIGPQAEIAAYAFSVLLRQLKAARAAYIKETLTRCKRAQKTKRADAFCKGWVYAVSHSVQIFARSEEDTAIVDAYTNQKYGSRLVLFKSRATGATRDYGDSLRGAAAGRDVTLNHGVGGIGGSQERIGHG